MAAFSLGRILVTAIACAIITGVVLVWRLRRDAGGLTQPVIVVPALSVGRLVIAWRLLGNAWRLNDDFLPGISVADLGGGAVAGLALLALAPLRLGMRRDEGQLARRAGAGASVRRRWLITSGLVAMAVSIANVVFI